MGAVRSLPKTDGNTDGFGDGNRCGPGGQVVVVALPKKGDGSVIGKSFTVTGTLAQI
jgi:hypothetical protein